MHVAWSYVSNKMGFKSAHSNQLIQSQVLGPVNYLNKKCYIVSKDEYFLKPSDKQIVGRLNHEATYYMIGKETYKSLNDQQQNTSNLQLMQQVLGPIYLQKSEIYVIGEAFSKQINKN